ncbi:hypothetical protein MHD_03380 [Mannheimia granulomatis]|uniref:DUF1425 domain-containing protein n=1 Tax=Mannheimia granulomatis TaxID=85402 RepID=A0A011ML04_9PAST|nr:YcfL family protein [Mannheimia granulomatis]EXI63186.1 hypothetical protein AK33_01955 [Mannheimia granulomatis]RGE49010.1 hypothetical protein MHD_03380 [Mannheimia granulomatis]
MMKSLSIVAIFSLFLTACTGKPVSYLPKSASPIVNIEANIADHIELETDDKRFATTNLTEFPLNIAYKLFWYDKDGVTQSFSNTDSTPWQYLWLQPKQKQFVTLTKPTPESISYRLYLRGSR